MQTLLPTDELTALNIAFEDAHPQEILTWALETSGLRRIAIASFVEQYELEADRWIVKINPMAGWTRRDVWAYLKDNELPHNPLYDLGFSSIGCAPCTRMQFQGEPERAGRWAGKSKWECGI